MAYLEVNLFFFCLFFATCFIPEINPPEHHRTLPSRSGYSRKWSLPYSLAKRTSLHSVLRYGDWWRRLSSLPKARRRKRWFLPRLCRIRQRLRRSARWTLACTWVASSSNQRLPVQVQASSRPRWLVRPDSLCKLLNRHDCQCCRWISFVCWRILGDCRWWNDTSEWSTVFYPQRRPHNCCPLCYSL